MTAQTAHNDAKEMLVTAQCQTTLLLDHHWMPIRVIPAGRVFYHLFRNRINGLDLDLGSNDTNSWISRQPELLATGRYPILPGPRQHWAVPTIGVVNNPFNRERTRSRRIEFEELLELYNHTCQICLERFPRSMFDPREIFNRDHVLPRSKGGPDDDFNIVLACKDCNGRKGDVYPYYNAKGEEIKTRARPHYFDVALGAQGIRPEWKPFLWRNKVA